MEQNRASGSTTLSNDDDPIDWQDSDGGHAVLDVGGSYDNINQIVTGSNSAQVPGAKKNRKRRTRPRGGLPKVSMDDFEKLMVLGTGAYATVFLVNEKRTGKQYAMKVLKKARVLKCKQAEHTMTERKILAQPDRHPFIVGLTYAFQTENTLNFVMDYCPGGELYLHLSTLGSFPEDRARFYCAELTLALSHLHDQGVVYRDLKPENILIDKTGHIKLADFGLSKRGILRCDQGAETFCGTPEYIAPEILQRKGHGTAVDWWSLGALLFEMLTGLPPWYSPNRQRMFVGICRGKLSFNSNAKAMKVSPCAQDLIRGLLNRDPEQRLGSKGGVSDIKEHLFFAEIDWDELLNRRVKAPWVPDDGKCFVDKETTRLPVHSVGNEGGGQLNTHNTTSTQGAPIAKSTIANKINSVLPPPVPIWVQDSSVPNSVKSDQNAPIASLDISPPVKNATFAEVVMGKYSQSGGSLAGGAKAASTPSGRPTPSGTNTVPIVSNSSTSHAIPLAKHLAESCSIFDGFSYTAPSSSLHSRSPHLGRSPQWYKRQAMNTDQMTPMERESNLLKSSMGSFPPSGTSMLQNQVTVDEVAVPTAANQQPNCLSQQGADQGFNGWCTADTTNLMVDSGEVFGTFEFEPDNPIDPDDLNGFGRNSPCASPAQQFYPQREC